MKIRRGFTLTELLGIIAVLASFMVAFAMLFNELAVDMPRSYRVVQMNASMLNMLRYMQKDVEIASGLPESFGEHKASDKVLLIESAKGVVSYRIEEGSLHRVPLGDSEQEKIVWRARWAAVEWDVLRKDGKGYAVEVKSRMEYPYKGRTLKKMANSYLFFAGVLETPVRSEQR